MKVPSKERFSQVARDYARFRPSYPPELLDWVVKEAALAPGAAVVDVGCGTGISTRLWADRGFSVTGVDPNEEMLAQARQAGGPPYRRGDEADTGLPAASADLVVAAQAFHWFDLDKAVGEFSRILKPRGWCAALWNLRAQTPFMLEYTALLARHCADFNDQPRGRDTILKILAHPRTGDSLRMQIPSSQLLDREGFLGRVHSTSYVAHGLRDAEGFEKALDGLYKRHGSSGAVSFAYDSVGLLWRIRDL